ncbi:MAG: hypothetical protein GDA36_11695 [Rhodobacteraceae bacterium]|nr:hypothetical protein [Paracoccaceae bacterium]
MNNDEKSQLVMAHILEKAMQVGIQEWTLSFPDLNLDKEYAPFFYPCLEWLEREELVVVKSYRKAIGGVASGCAYNVHLTSRGQATMKQQIDIAGQNEEVAETVKKVSSAPEQYTGFGAFLGGVLGGFTKSIGSS